MSAEFDVGVVGYGPGARTLTALLSRRGFKVVAFERYPRSFDLPRAGHLDHETMRVVQAVGDAHGLAEKLLKIYDDIYWYGAEGQQVMVQPLRLGMGASGWHSDYSIWQPHFDDELHRAAIEAGAVVNMGWDVVAVRPSDSDVEITANRMAYDEGGQSLERTEDYRRVRARYVVAGDGGGSFTRTTLGIDRDDHGFNERWFGVDLERIDGGAIPSMAQYCDPKRPHVMTRLGPTHRRFNWMVMPEDSVEELYRPETAWRMLAEWDVTPENHAIVRQTVYRFQAKIARRWRDGRVLLAGDAAHTMPPYAGQGLGSAVRDAANLAWKLDLVLSNKVDDELLDSYETERHPHVAAWTTLSIALGEFACVTDPVKAAERDARLEAGERLPPWDVPKLTRGILQHDGGDVADLVGSLGYQRRVRVGSDEALFDDIFGGARFSVLAIGADPRDSLSPTQIAFLEESLGAIITGIWPDDDGSGRPTDIDGEYASYFEEHGIVAIVNRPDFYVFGAVTSLDELGALIGDLRAQLRM